MTEEMLCILGRNPKILSYVDEKNNTYIQTICKLKESITTTDLKIFFDKVYQMKIAQEYSNFFKPNYNTNNLIKCFKSILVEKDVINLQELCNILNSNCCEASNPASNAIQEFFDKFEILDVYAFSLTEYACMIRVNHLNPLFQSTKSKFSKEEKAMKYNTTLIEIQEYQEELKEKTQVVKRRVKLKK